MCANMQTHDEWGEILEDWANRVKDEKTFQKAIMQTDGLFFGKESIQALEERALLDGTSEWDALRLGLRSCSFGLYDLLSPLGTEPSWTLGKEGLTLRGLVWAVNPSSFCASADKKLIVARILAPLWGWIAVFGRQASLSSLAQEQSRAVD